MTSFQKRSSIAVVTAALLIGGFFVVQTLGNATLYFLTADEAAAQRVDLGDKRFRLEGLVRAGSIRTEGESTLFDVESKGVLVPVRNSGQPVGIFQENIPVVLEGRFQAGTDEFASDRMLVRHSSDYQAEYPDRVSGEANKQ